MSTPGFEDDKGGLPENLTKRILSLGLGAFFLTEDTVRRYVRDAKIPRDIARSITQNASKGKEELYGFVARELSGFLKQMDLQEELGRFMKTHKIRVSAEVEFMRKEPLPRGSGESSVEGDLFEESQEGPSVEWDVSVKTSLEPEPASDSGRQPTPDSESSEQSAETDRLDEEPPEGTP